MKPLFQLLLDLGDETARQAEEQSAEAPADDDV
jgi:hypothetical protein